MDIIHNKYPYGRKFSTNTSNAVVIKNKYTNTKIQKNQCKILQINGLSMSRTNGKGFAFHDCSITTIYCLSEKFSAQNIQLVETLSGEFHNRSPSVGRNWPSLLT